MMEYYAPTEDDGITNPLSIGILESLVPLSPREPPVSFLDVASNQRLAATSAAGIATNQLPPATLSARQPPVSIVVEPPNHLLRIDKPTFSSQSVLLSSGAEIVIGAAKLLVALGFRPPVSRIFYYMYAEALLFLVVGILGELALTKSLGGAFFLGCLRAHFALSAVLTAESLGLMFISFAARAGPLYLILTVLGAFAAFGAAAASCASYYKAIGYPSVNAGRRPMERSLLQRCVQRRAAGVVYSVACSGELPRGQCTISFGGDAVSPATLLRHAPGSSGASPATLLRHAQRSGAASAATLLHPHLYDSTLLPQNPPEYTPFPTNVEREEQQSE